MFKKYVKSQLDIRNLFGLSKDDIFRYFKPDLHLGYKDLNLRIEANSRNKLFYKLNEYI